MQENYDLLRETETRLVVRFKERFGLQLSSP